MQIISREHNMLKRQALILKAGTYHLTDQDRARLKVPPQIDLGLIVLAPSPCIN